MTARLVLPYRPFGSKMQIVAQAFQFLRLTAFPAIIMYFNAGGL